ncbi:GNAT family N-acetyltransferase [Methylococcaceae bacterium CS1]|nr:GNAT family N-acetyltransferase [Methylococcaceae bacterium CS4]TXK96816.1 GNAT family N-acetyltransferase [Methylococcaceae bacterium CS5]TXL02562.1 GNAT family N-acetyltransferase [Methylococcaceae bacterium CS3]TXL02631.1 GNAT family N-acetyltransferase [Methylococcaceae bacterium CS1]TXL08115.1 GNAT family N-acetyltransferase [Methylococcaceae bacterium CS2]
MAFASQFELLDPKSHASKVFDCGNDEMNQFLKRYADKNRKLGLSSTWVLPEQQASDSEAKTKLGAYYTLASSTVTQSEIPHDKKLPAYPVPVVILARIAIDKHYQKQGLGKKTLITALRKAVELTENGLPALGVVLDILNDDALAFYKTFEDFQPFDNDPMRLFISMKVVKQLG